MKCPLKLVFLFFEIIGPALANEPMTSDELEKWFVEDINDDEARAMAVNEGKLEFLIKRPSKAVHSSRNILTIDKESIETGWVGLIQCHQNLGAVAEMQVVYRYKRMRNLRVDSFEGIKRAWVEGSSVQLVDIKRGAKICIQAEVGILYSRPDGSLILKNGPFHRKYFDGYYPMHVNLEIRYPMGLLRFESITPMAQPRFSLSHTSNSLKVDA
ncbi:MAG: hypothetical protein QNK31_06545 [Porticoccus sp.]|nr:hypothetical protein [Porticoccus sp.]